jgi:hypothetical protein
MKYAKDNDIKIISYDEGLNFAKENGACDYIECSAKTQEGISNAYDLAIKFGIKKEKKKTSIFTSIFKKN